MKKIALSTAILAAVVTALPFSSVVAATPMDKLLAKHTYQSVGFSEEHPMTDAMIKAAKERRAHRQDLSKVPYKTETFTMSSNGVIQPNTTTPNWSYQYVDSYNYILTANPIYITQTENVKITFVQYPSDGIGTADNDYQLIDRAEYDPTNSVSMMCYGNFTSTNTSITFYGVQNGSYDLQIYNNNASDQVSGNGFTYY